MNTTGRVLLLLNVILAAGCLAAFSAHWFLREDYQAKWERAVSDAEHLSHEVETLQEERNTLTSIKVAIEQQLQVAQNQIAQLQDENMRLMRRQADMEVSLQVMTATLAAIRDNLQEMTSRLSKLDERSHPALVGVLTDLQEDSCTVRLTAKPGSLQAGATVGIVAQ